MNNELENTVEGLIHVSTIRDDHYVYDEDKLELIGERTNRHFKLGEKVIVKLTDANEMARTIDFELV